MVVIPRRAATAFVGTVVVVLLLFGFKTPDQSIGATTGGSAGVVADGGTTSAAPDHRAAPAVRRRRLRRGLGHRADRRRPAPSAASGFDQVTGPTVSTRYGPVQVRVTVSDGKVTEITALQLPSGGRSAGSPRWPSRSSTTRRCPRRARRSTRVSGATYTSDAYEQSLQAALDQAGI